MLELTDPVLLVTAVLEPALSTLALLNVFVGEAFAGRTFVKLTLVLLLTAVPLLVVTAGLMAAALASVFVRLTGAYSLPLRTQLFYEAVVLDTAPNVPTWLVP